MTLTSFAVKKTLMIASAYAAFRGGEIMDKRANGINCDPQRERLQLLFGMIDSIQEYGCIYENPSIVFNVTAVVPGARVIIIFGALNVQLPEITFTTAVNSEANQELADAINAMNNGWTAKIIGTGVLISAVNGHIYNGYPVSLQTVGVSFSFPAGFTLTTTGDDFFNRYPERCLADNEIQTVLYKINSFVDVPCEKFVQF